MPDIDLDPIFEFPGLNEIVAQVEAAMIKSLDAGPTLLGEPSRRQILAGGKRLRPALVIATANILAEPTATAVHDGAAAVELIHTGSLIHDDIIDKADKRRGVDTINYVEGDDVALLAGDFVMGLAGEAATRASQAIGAVLSHTIVGLCQGQMAETEMVFRADRTIESYENALQGKTAALMSACCTIGVLAVTPEDVASLEAFGRYGYHFGMAFQIIDDVLDAIATSEGLGKEIGKDIRAGVLTLPFILARDEADAAITDLINKIWAPARVYDSYPPLQRLNLIKKDEALQALDGQGANEEVARVVDAIRDSVFIDKAIDHARRHNQLAKESLDEVGARSGAEKALARLATLPDAYMTEQLGKYR